MRCMKYAIGLCRVYYRLGGVIAYKNIDPGIKCGINRRGAEEDFCFVAGATLVANIDVAAEAAPADLGQLYKTSVISAPLR